MLTDSDIARVLTFYDLGAPRCITQATHGYVNETAFVETSSGRFVVRRNHRRRNLAAHCYRHTLIAWLCDHGAPAPALIPTRAGATLLTLDDRHYEILIYIPGQDYDPDRPQQLHDIGATLARYHCAVADFPPPPEFAPPRYVAESVLALIEQVIERDVMADLREPLDWYSRRAAYLRDRFPAASYAGLPHLVIHGDVHPDNFRFADDRVVALLDYDQAVWDARLVDVADALVAFATAEMPDRFMWGVYQGPLDQARAICLVASYAEIAPPLPEEIGALPTVIEILWLRGQLGRLLSTPEGDPSYHRTLLAQGRWLSDWMREHTVWLVDHWFSAITAADQARQRLNLSDGRLMLSERKTTIR